jgi:hypothetical protein
VILPEFIKKPILSVFHKAVEINFALQGRAFQYVFVLAHMRSGSTLLSHILSSHPDFVGAGETHTFYKTPADMRKLAPRTCQLLRTMQLSGKYLVDKITMDWYLTDDTLSQLPIYKSVILIREPEAALKSIIGLFKWKEEMALHHYVTRLEMLGRYGQVLGQRAIFIEYDDLVDRPRETLAGLTRFFEADPPFTESYERSKITGKMGDPSKNISKGHIFRTPGHEISVSESAIAEARAAFYGCRERLSSAGTLFAVAPSALMPAVPSRS